MWSLHTKAGAADGSLPSPCVARLMSSAPCQTEGSYKHCLRSKATITSHKSTPLSSQHRPKLHRKHTFQGSILILITPRDLCQQWMKKGFKHIRQDHCCPRLWISLLPYQDTVPTCWAHTPQCQGLAPAAFHCCLRNYHRRLHAIRPQKWGCQSSRGTEPAS